jgi:hypothetical protein
LKPLFRAVLGGPSYAYDPQSHERYMRYNSKDKSQTGRSAERDGEQFEMYGYKESGGVTIAAVSRKDKLGPDNISEESFLPVQTSVGEEGIIRTMQVSIHREKVEEKVDKPTHIEDRV